LLLHLGHKLLKREMLANHPFEGNSFEQVMFVIDLEAPTGRIDGGGHPLTAEALANSIPLQINTDRPQLVDFAFQMVPMPGAQPAVGINGGRGLWYMRQTGKGSQRGLVGTTHSLIRALEIVVIAEQSRLISSFLQRARTIL
jgi:hypothetical protein